VRFGRTSACSVRILTVDTHARVALLIRIPYASGIRATVIRRLIFVLDDSRGYAFLTAVFCVFLLGMVLLAFESTNHSEIASAMLHRDSTLALDLAESGAQEAMTRLTSFGAVAGVTSFNNSLAGTGSFARGGTGHVTFQNTLQNNPSIFPILSTATFAGAQRRVRYLVKVSYQAGWGSIVFGPQMAASGDESPTVGDLYSHSGMSFASYAQSPLCSAASTAQSLQFPQVMAGTTISAGAGVSATPPCGTAPNVTGTATTECATFPISATELAPTSCPGGRATVGGVSLPVNWHPMTPVGMPAADFTAIVNTPPLLLALFGISVTPATQNGTAVTYQPAGTYTPSYWSTVPWTNGRVVLVIATQPFCVAPLLGVALPTPAILGTCLLGFNYYGSQTGGTAHATRFIDWGLVTDDLTRTPPQTFFEPAPCSQCPGNQNGIRYVPAYPSLDVLGHACQASFTPGTNVFDQINTADGVSCAPPTQTISANSVTFGGTVTTPETLSIDNAGMSAVTVTSALPPFTNLSSMTCANTDFNPFNWGLILATGDLNLSNMVFSGFIYTTGTVYINGTVLLQGGVFATSVQPATGPSNKVSDAGTLKFCSQGSPIPLLTPRVYSFTRNSWEDVPLNQH